MPRHGRFTRRYCAQNQRSFFFTWRRSDPLRYIAIFCSYKYIYVTAEPPGLTYTRTSPSRVTSCLRSLPAPYSAACAADPIWTGRQLVELLLLAVDAPLATEFRVQAVDLQSQLRDLLLKCEHA